MKTGQLCWFCLAAVLATAANVRAEAVHNGKPLSAWQGLLQSPDSNEHMQAINALGDMGPSAQPAVSSLLAVGKQPAFHAVVETALLRIGSPAVADLVQGLRDANADVRQLAARVLGRLEPPARTAIPELQAVLNDPAAAVQLQAALSLCNLGHPNPKAIDLLVATLQDPKAPQRLEVLQILPKLGKNAKAALPTLLNLLNDPNYCDHAAIALGKIGPEAKAAVPALVQLLQQKQQKNQFRPVRDTHLAAALALLDLQAEQEAALAVLVAEGVTFQSIWNGHAIPSEFLAEVPGRLLGQGDRALPLLIAALEHPKNEVRAGAARLLSQVPKLDAKAVTALRAALDEVPDVSRWAAIALVNAGHKDAGLPHLVNALPEFPGSIQQGHSFHNHFDWHTVAVQALRRVGAAAVPALLKGLESPNPLVRAGSADVLAQLGQAAKGRDILLKMLIPRGEKAELHKDAIWAAIALAENANDRKVVLPILLEEARQRHLLWPRKVNQFKMGEPTALYQLFREGEDLPETGRIHNYEFWENQPAQAALRHQQETVVAVLVHLGPAIRPLLLAALDDPRTSMRTASAEILIRGIQQEKGTSGLKAVLAALSSNKVRLRRSACIVLGEVGPTAQPATPALTNLLKDADVRVRVRAAEALWKIARDDKRVVPVLTAALQDKDSTVWAAAARTLGQIGPPAEAALPALVNRLDAQDGNVRQEVLHAIFRIPRDWQAPLLQALNHARPDVRQSAALALGQCGPVVVPALTDQLNAPQVLVRQAALEAFQRLGKHGQPALKALRARLQDEDARVRLGAAACLVNLQDSLTEVVPVLAALLQHQEAERCRQAAQILRDMSFQSDAVFEPLQKALQHKDGLVRSAALDGLSQLKNRGQEVLPLLMAGLKDEAFAVRNQALAGLRTVAARLKDVKPLVTTLLALRTDKNALQRQQVMTLLSLLAARVAEPKPFVAALLDTLKTEPQPKTLRQAVIALTRVKGEPELVVQGLLAALEHENDSIADFAEDGLRQLGVQSMPYLLVGLKSKKAETRELIANLLGDLGPVVRKEATAPLLALLPDGHKQVRQSVIQALGRIQAEGNPVCDGLAGCLQDKEANVRAAAAAALGSLKVGARSLLPQLLAATTDTESNVRYNAVRALVAFPEDGQQILPVLQKALQDKESYVRQAALEVFIALNPGPKGAPQLVELLQNSAHAEIRGTAAYRLGELKTADAKTVAALVTALKDATANVRASAAAALGKFAKVSALPALLETLKDSEPQVRTTVVMALGQYGPAAKEAIPALRLALRDREEQVRLGAVEALKQIER